MEETLIIKNFGPIESVELKLKRFNILIGEQGTGKSTVAKVLIAIQNTVFKIRNTTLKQGFDPAFRGEWIDKHTELFLENLNLVELNSYINPNTEIIYKPVHNELQTPAYSFMFREKNAEIVLNRELTMKENLDHSIDYIPSERTLINIISDALFGLAEIGTPIPKLLSRFGSKFNKAKKIPLDIDYKEILGVKFRYENNEGFIILPSGKLINISVASSAIQTAIPLLLVFDYIISNESFITEYGLKNYVIIEEPELNLFPLTQDKLVKHLSQHIASRADAKQMNYSHHLLITTHSPYILTSLNNLLYAYQVGQEHEEEIEAIVEKKYWLNPNDVSAYRLFPDGTAKNIMDDEINQIDVGEIDEVSRKLNGIWDKIADIEFSSVDEN